MILGVPYNASKPEIKEAFIRLSKTLHPDVNTSVNANEEFQRVKILYLEKKNVRNHNLVFGGALQRFSSYGTKIVTKCEVKTARHNGVKSFLENYY